MRTDHDSISATTPAEFLPPNAEPSGTASDTFKFLEAICPNYKGDRWFGLNEYIFETSDSDFIAANEGHLRLSPLTPAGLCFMFAAQPLTEESVFKSRQTAPTITLERDGMAIRIWAFERPVNPDDWRVEGLVDMFGMEAVDEPIPLPGTDGWRMVQCNPKGQHTLDFLSGNLLVDEPVRPTHRMAKIITPYNEKDYAGKMITVSLGPNQFAKDWQPKTISVSGLMDQYCLHSEGPKDGLAAVLADMVPGRRQKKTIKACTAIGLDIDTGTPSAEVDKALAKLGCLAVRTTTHSHNKTRSELTKDPILKFAPDADILTTEIIREYLTVKKNWDKSIVDSVEYVGDDQTEAGIVAVVTHIPMPKHRVIIPMSEPFVIVNEGRTQQEAMAKWAQVPFAMARLLGVPFDKSCTDPSRLFYTPRHAKGRPFEISLFGGPVFDRRALRLDDDFAALAKQFTKGGSKSKTVEGKRLAKWFKQRAHGFQVMDAIETFAPDHVRSKATYGYNIICPFDEDHSNAGDPSDQACYAVNAADGGNEFFIIKCQHETCGDKTILDMLGKLIKDEVLPESILTDEAYNIAELDSPEQKEAAGKNTASAKSDETLSDGYGGALAFESARGIIPRGVSFDKETKTIHPTFRNALLLIGHEGWDLGYNELTQTYGLRGDVAYPWPFHLGYALNDAIRREIRLYLLRRWGVTFKIDDIYEATMTLARRNTFNPVCEYLSEVEAQWDGTPRVERWLETYMGVKVTNVTAVYVRAVGKITLAAAVRRARDPGCKFDELLTLEGPQGGGKSTAIGTLGGEFYSDAKLGDLENTQKVGMKLRGTWIHEFGELVGLTKAGVEEVKDFLSKRADRFKQPYGRSEDDYPRRCVMIGTVNPGGGAYLVDLTGNRRFWPVACGEIDLDALARDRDQLWAEAAMMESRGDAIRLDPSLYDVAKTEQDARLADDPWVEILRDYLDGKRARGETRVLSKTLLSLALELSIEKQTQVAMKKLKGAMALIPTWEYKTTTRADGGRSAGYEYVGA